MSVPLRKPFTIHIYTIAKNEEKFVERWVQSCKDADGLHVLDTGSTDKTVEKLKALGVNVKSTTFEPWKTLEEYDAIVKRGGKPWRFDAARNENMDMIPDDADICLQVDMDEVMKEGWKKDILKKWRWDTNRMRFYYASSMNTDFDTATKEGHKPRHVLYYDKLHSRHGWEWKKPVHEILMPKTGTTEVGVDTHETLYYHYPDAGKSRWSYLPMLELAVREEPEDPRNWIYYGRELYFNGQNEVAIATLSRFLNMPGAGWNFERCYACTLIADCYDRQKNNDMKERWLLKACAEEPNQREGWVKLADHYRLAGDNLAGYVAVLRALKVPHSWRVYCSDTSAYGAWPHDLANILGFHAGFKEQAIRHGWNALKTDPFLCDHLISNYVLALETCGRPQKTKTAKVDVIILSYAKNQQKYEMTKAGIRCLRLSSPEIDWRITVVESNRGLRNESYAGNVLFAEEVTVMMPDETFGYNKFLSRAYEAQCKDSDAPYVMILNDDVVAFSDGFGSKMIEALGLFSSVCPNGLRESKWGRIDESRQYTPGYDLNVVNGWCIMFDKAILKSASFETFFPPEIIFHNQDCYYAEMLKYRGLRHALTMHASALHMQAQSIGLLDKETKCIYTLGQQAVYDNLIATTITHTQPKETRVFDCFTFFNELDILEMRLNELDRCVDKFVLVEATKTHSGKDKPLYFFEARGESRFEKFLSKIEHVIVEDMPEGDDRWVRENFQRNAILRGLARAGAQNGDLVMISDADEIPNPLMVDIKMIGVYRQQMYCYCYNILNTVEQWRGTVAVPFAVLTVMKPQELRDARYAKPRVIENGGWHFSWIGKQDKLLEKLGAFAHSEYDNDEVREKLADRMERMVDFAGRSEEQFKVVEIDGSFPKFLQFSKWLVESESSFSKLIAPTGQKLKETHCENEESPPVEQPSVTIEESDIPF